MEHAPLGAPEHHIDQSSGIVRRGRARVALERAFNHDEGDVMAGVQRAQCQASKRERSRIIGTCSSDCFSMMNRSLAVSGDDLMVFDNTMDHLLAFDLDTAERRVVTNNGFPRGESLPAMNSLSVVGDDFYGHAYTGFGRVDADNEFELLAGSFDNPNSTTFVYQMAVNPAGTTAYTYEWALVNNVWEPQIKRYDLATGNATVLSSNTVPDSDNGFNYISDMLFDADGNRLIVMAGEQVLAVDAASGARTVVFDDPNMPLVHAWDIAHDVVGDRLLIADTANDYLVAVDLATGAGSQFSTLPVSGETDLSVPVWVSCDENGNLWVLDSDERLLRVDGQTGSRSVLIDVAALDDVFPEYWGEIVSVDGRVFVQSYEGILEIDPESGEFVKVYGTAQSSPGNNT